MQMDLRNIEEIANDSKGGIIEKKDATKSTISIRNSDAGPTTPPVDAAGALQLFLDHIPISSIPGIQNSPSSCTIYPDSIPSAYLHTKLGFLASLIIEFVAVMVVTTHECVKNGIKMLYENNASGALIADSLEPDQTAMFTTSFSNPYVGFISFSNMVLWSLQEYKKHQSETMKDHAKSSNKIKPQGFFSLLEKIPVVSEAKIGELAASSLWNPVFPVKLDQTIFHVLLLLSKHRLSVVPVTEYSTSNVIGYVTENSVNHILLQSSGLEWFDSIADKPLSDFRFEHNDRVVSIYNDQTIAEAVHILWTNKVYAIAVVHRQTHKLVGGVRVDDIRRLLDDDQIFTDREDISVEQFIHTNTDADQYELKDHTSARTLAMNNNFKPRMDTPVTNTQKDTLKQAMQNLAEKNSNFSFLVDEYKRVRGMVTLRDILMEFAPPCMDSRIDGGGFFDIALKESGCTIRDGTMVHLK